jgi:hypothetical protein
MQQKMKAFAKQLPIKKRVVFVGVKLARILRSRESYICHELSATFPLIPGVHAGDEMTL